MFAPAPESEMTNSLAAKLARLTIVTLCVLPGGAATVGGKSPVLTVTVNIVLANRNGIVVLTDSNQTVGMAEGRPHTSRLSGQKLFRIDDRTVCTVAGFGATSLPEFPDFTSSAAGVLDKYVVELSRKGGVHGFREKLTSLEFLFDMQLSGIGNLQHLTEKQAGDYGLAFILAGYDTDGTAKIGKVVLGTSLSATGVFSPVLKQLSEKVVGRDLVYETAGIGGAAVENILNYPMQLAEEPEIRAYANSKSLDHGSSLTTVEMEALAMSLSRHSALVNRRYVDFSTVWWPVGGRNQIAILKEGSVQHIDQQLFEPRKLNMVPFGMIEGVTVSTGGRADIIAGATTPGTLGLFVKMGFVGTVLLDNGYFFEDDFRSGILYYDGGVLGFDPSNRAIDCTLRLGPHADPKSPNVRQLIAGFAWKAIEYRGLF